MMPNMDPRMLKGMMAKMGIKSSEIDAQRVVIYCSDKEIVIEQPQITKIEMQGSTSFQVTGSIEEKEREINIEISEDDVKMVMEKTGITDTEEVREAIKAANGDIAQAIMDLTR